MSVDVDLERHGLPPVPNGREILEARTKMPYTNWYIRTEEGWFYCHGTDVPLEKRKWEPSYYGPTI